jgi:hypothetical protein
VTRHKAAGSRYRIISEAYRAGSGPKMRCPGSIKNKNGRATNKAPVTQAFTDRTRGSCFSIHAPFYARTHPAENHSLFHSIFYFFAPVLSIRKGKAEPKHR